jgi:hypothetical protein
MPNDFLALCHVHGTATQNVSISREKLSLTRARQTIFKRSSRRRIVSVSKVNPDALRRRAVVEMAVPRLPILGDGDVHHSIARGHCIVAGHQSWAKKTKTCLTRAHTVEGCRKRFDGSSVPSSKSTFWHLRPQSSEKVFHVDDQRALDDRRDVRM